MCTGNDLPVVFLEIFEELHENFLFWMNCHGVQCPLGCVTNPEIGSVQGAMWCVTEHMVEIVQYFLVCWPVLSFAKKLPVICGFKFRQTMLLLLDFSIVIEKLYNYCLHHLGAQALYIYIYIYGINHIIQLYIWNSWSLIMTRSEKCIT